MSEPQGKFTQYHGNLFISHYYKIYFPAYIIAMLVSVLFGDLLISTIVGVPPANVLDGAEGAGQYTIHLFLSLGILSPLFVIIISDMEIRKLGIAYTHEKRKMGLKMSILMLIVGLGFFFLLSTLIKFLFSLQYGKFFVSDSLINPSSPDYSISFAADFIRIINVPQIYNYLVILGFILTYVSMEFILRGLIANEGRGFRFGIVGAVVLPALMQGVTYTYGTFLFTSPAKYFISFFIFFTLGFFGGLIYWKTGRFSMNVIYSVLAFLLQPGSSFQINFLSGFPDFFGEYNLYDAQETPIEIIGNYMGYINVSLIIIAPIIALMAYSEIWQIFKDIWAGLKKYWLGILIVWLAFTVIDLIFSFFTSSNNPLGSVLGFIIALVFVGFAINFIMKVLPPPTSIEDVMRESEKLHANERFPVTVSSDIMWLDSDEPWWFHYKIVAVLIAIGYLYLLFIAGAQRQLELLDAENQIRYIIFFAVLPSFLFGLGSFFTIRALKRGYMFQKPWRSRLVRALQFLFLVNLYIWATSAAITKFSWAVVPLFVAFAITIWPPEIDNAIKDFSQGFTHNRIATFRWIDHDPASFEDASIILRKSQIGTVAVGAYIASARHNFLEEWELIEDVRSSDLPQKIIGASLALGIMGTKSAEGVLIDSLKSDDFEIKKAVFWALGKVGTSRALPFMIDALESSPSSSIVEIAEESILRIDPDFPLAGLRDNLTITL